MSDPRICLNMIVRNEAAIIERCLVSVLPAIDYYVICDTGSSDDTVARIREVMDAHGVEGEIHHTEFHDFGSARNEALERCRDSQAAFDYILLTDADMELRIADAGFRKMLTAPAYAIRQYNRLSYYNTRLLRRDHKVRYHGLTHEYLRAGWPVPRIDGLSFYDHACGSSRPQKFERDVPLLKLELERDPRDGRAMFYLAQTYRGHGDHHLAIEWYRRRAEADGWDEERWYALYAAALCHRDLGEDEAFIRAALDAYRARPSRAEPLHALAHHYRDRKRWEDAMTVAEIGSALLRPAGDSGFLHQDIYAFGFTEEISIAGFYSTDPARRAAGRSACASLATRRDVPAYTRQTARRNWVYYAKQAADLFGSCEIREPDFYPQAPWIGEDVAARIAAAPVQENWVPLLRGDELLFVCSTDPLIVAGCHKDGALREVARHEPVPALDDLRGSARAVSVDGGWLYLTREESVFDSGRVHLHRFVHIGEDFALQGITEPFWFLDRQIELATGLGIAGDSILVSFATMDGQSWVARFDTAAVLRLLQHDGV